MTHKFGEEHTVVFPIYMYSHLKFNYDSHGQALPRGFTENLT